MKIINNMGKEKEVLEPQSSEVVDYNTLDQIEVKLDQNKIDAVQKELDERVKEFNDKVYAVSMNVDTFNKFREYIEFDAEWSGVESLGIDKISKALSEIKKEGIKDSLIYMKALELEASHYFISRMKGKGLVQAVSFLSIYRALDEALDDVKKDSADLNEIRTRLKAAQQGIEVA
jgi:hypothetical protein